MFALIPSDPKLEKWMMEKLALPFFARIHFAKRFSQTLKYHSWYPFGLGFLEIHFGKTPRCVQLLAKEHAFKLIAPVQAKNPNKRRQPEEPPTPADPAGPEQEVKSQRPKAKAKSKSKAK